MAINSINTQNRTPPMTTLFNRLFHRSTCRLAMILALLAGLAPSPAGAQPVKIFILAGQSNMEGKAQVALLERQLHAPATRDLFAHLQRNGQWIERDDVWIKFLDRQGPLTVGYGSPGRIGPELEFGHVMGNHFSEPVLLIKTAWGGKSLFRDFRPPSAGLPDDGVLAGDLEQARRQSPGTTLDEIKDSYGVSYRAMIQEIETTLARCDQLFPALAGREKQLAGFVWFQGWNDMINVNYTAAYAENLAHFIRDVRHDLRVPQLPFVIGVMGVDGADNRADLQPNPKKLAFKRAQAAVGELPEFQGNVAVVQTDVFWDMQADAVFRKGWQEHREEWDQVGSDMPYHYLGSPRTCLAIGGAFARAVIALGDGTYQPEPRREPAPGPEAVRFDPVIRELEGWTVHVEPALIDGEHADEGRAALAMLGNHLQRIKLLVPQPQLGKLQQIGIWLEHSNPRLGAMQYHPSKGWLVANRHDPRLTKMVHITQARDLLSREQMLKHPAVILHELAHGYHDQFLDFDNPEIIVVFEQARAAGSYEKVLLYTGETVKHYGLNNHKEYFAEGTEAYFYRNDFYPFVRAELQQHDPALHDLLKRIWGD